MNTAFFLTYPADAVMPPEYYNNKQEQQYEEPQYVEEKQDDAPVETIDIEAAPITPAKEETQAPTEVPTAAIQGGATTETHASVAATEAHSKTEAQYSGLIQALYIVIPLLLIALITVIIMLIVSKSKKKKAAAAQQYMNGNTPYNGYNINQPNYPNNDNDPKA